MWLLLCKNQSAKTCLDAKRKTMCKCTKHVASPKACKSRRTSLSFEPPMHHHAPTSRKHHVKCQHLYICFTIVLNFILFMIFILTILHFGSSRIPFEKLSFEALKVKCHDCHEPPISKSWTTTSGYLSTAIRWCCTFSERMPTQLSCLGLSYKSTPFRHGSVSLPMFHSRDTWDHNGSGTQVTIDATPPHVHNAAPHRHMSDEN